MKFDIAESFDCPCGDVINLHLGAPPLWVWYPNSRGGSFDAVERRGETVTHTCGRRYRALDAAPWFEPIPPVEIVR